MSLSTPTVPLRSIPSPGARPAPSPARPTFEPSAGGRELKGRTPRVASPTQGWLSVLLGLPFAAAGAATIALALGHGTIAEGGKLTFPPFAVGALGLCFAVTGLSFVAYGLVGVARKRGLAALRARYPDQPWMVDYPWDRKGGRDEAPDEIARTLWFVAFMATFLVPFHWVAFVSRERPFVFQLVTLIFDAIGVGMLGRVVYLVARRIRYGPSRIALARFPIAPGTTAELLLDGLSPVARAFPIRATLRCVEERFEIRQTGRNRTRVSVSYELYRDETTVAPGEARLRFELPENVPGTRLSAVPPRYWEVELAAETPGVDFGARFLVPVY
jgi:hypothetical protein